MEARIIDLPKILDRRGNLSIIEEENHIPFKIKRTFLEEKNAEVMLIEKIKSL